MEINGQPGELKFSLEIKRAETGETETVELVGKIGESLITEGDKDGSSALDSGA